MRARALPWDRAAAAAAAGDHEIFEQSVPWDGVVLVARGEVDAAAVPELRARLEAAAIPGGRLLVDLCDVTFIDSLALAAILGAKRRMGPGARLAIATSHHYVLLILQAGGLDGVVEIFPTRDEARAHLLA